MLFHGVDKVIGGVGWMGGMLSSKGLPAFLMYGVYLGEVVAPILLLLGVATRLSAFLIAFTMAMAVYLLHMDDLFRLGDHGEYVLELHLFYAVGAVCCALIGPGRFAIPVKGKLSAL